MSFTPCRAAPILFAVSVALAGAAQAQSGFVTEPRNLPPESFAGDTFVDNAGCIFVRAGFNGNTTWVPRVNRAREAICGQDPTFPDSPTTTADAAPRPAAAPDTAPEAVAPAPARAEPTETAAVAADPARTVRPQASAPPRIVRSAPIAEPMNGTMRGTTGPVMASGPRVVPAPRVSGAAAPAEVSAPAPSAQAGPIAPGPDAWIVPRHVYENRSVDRPRVPAGFRPAWDDDRLNPYRAWQKVEGYIATQRVWTNTVPRDSISAGDPAPVPAAPQIAYRGTGPAPREQLILRSDGSFRSNSGGSGVVLATSGAAATDDIAPAQQRFVHVGAFTTQARADEAAARLQAAGLPVRFGTHSRSGQALRAVLVGPFASDAGMRDALVRVRAAGYAAGN